MRIPGHAGLLPHFFLALKFDLIFIKAILKSQGQFAVLTPKKFLSPPASLPEQPPGIPGLALKGHPCIQRQNQRQDMRSALTRHLYTPYFL